MAIFQITAAKSITTTGASQDAFTGDTPVADTLIVDAHAYLWATGVNAFDLRAIDANTKNGAAVNDAFSFIGADLFSGVAGQLRIYAPAGDLLL